MRLSLLFAKRYLLSRKSLSVINIISGVSSLTVAIPVMAMVVLLSVFNGLDSLIKSMYKNFDPDIMITAVEGKFFDKNEINYNNLLAIDGVEQVSFVLEENALFEYRDRQFIGTVKGVDSTYSKIVPIDSLVVNGKYEPYFGDLPQAIIGQGVAYNLMLGSNLIEPLMIYMPRRGSSSSLLPIDVYRRKDIFPSGTFALDNETDGKYVIVPIAFAQDLMEYDSTKVSSAMVKLKPGANSSKIQSKIRESIGTEFKTLNRYQQKETFYRIMQYEKWGIYFIILMVLIIASFSIVGSLVMIIIDKRKDTETLLTLGATRRFISTVFIQEGMLISGIGATFGLIIGIMICLLQQQFGFVQMAGSSFLVDAYPVEIRLTDLVGIVISVCVVNYIMARLTVKRMIK